MRVLKYLTVAVTVTAMVAGAFVLGIVFERVRPRGLDIGADTSTTSEQVDRVKEILQDQALKPSSEATMTRGAIEGMLRSLDDTYAAYFDARHFRYFTEQTKGEFYGIGVNIAVREGKAIIVAPMKGTPAAKAGIKAEDQIVSIDGTEKKKWDLDEVVARVRGPEGTTVTLGIKRKGASTQVFKIKRARIVTPNIESRMIGDDVGYIRLYGFNEEAARQIHQAIRSLGKRGAKGYVLDLRDNPGGLLAASADVTSLFVPDGVVVRVDERDKPEEVYRVNGMVDTRAPLVVLVNENSASASEIVAGALQDHKRATLVGVKTFGKGSVQTIEQLPGGSAIKFTVAHYLTPKGRSINEKGLEPDVVVPMDFKQQIDPKKDTQLKKAVEVLRDKL